MKGLRPLPLEEPILGRVQSGGGAAAKGGFGGLRLFVVQGQKFAVAAAFERAGAAVGVVEEVFDRRQQEGAELSLRLVRARIEFWCSMR